MIMTRVAAPDAKPRSWPRIWGRGLLLALAVAALSVLAIRYAVRFTGLAALLVMFVGSGWLAVQVLRARWARFGRPPG